MKCDEVQQLHGPYFDSELDARTTFEIGQHLKSCSDCTRVFAQAEKLAASLKSALNRGQRTAPLWEQIERSVTVAAAAAATAGPRRAPRASQPGGWQAILLLLREQLQAGWRRSPRAWTGLAAAWLVIVSLHFASREPSAPLVASQEMPSASEIRSAWAEKQLLMADLAGASEPSRADKSKAVPPGPRSDRRKETLNS